MKINHRKIADKLALDLADYVCSYDREQEDYERHCYENDLNPNDFLNNADLEGGHIYAKAMAYLFHIEQLEQSQAEGNIDER